MGCVSKMTPNSIFSTPSFRISKNSLICPICNTDAKMQIKIKICSLDILIHRLNYLFGCRKGSYKISRACGIITCYTINEIVCGRLIIDDDMINYSVDDGSFIWYPTDARIELYFSNYNFGHSRTIELLDLITRDLNAIFSSENFMIKNELNLIDHGIYLI